MEVDMLDNTERKDANCKVTNHKLCPRFHFMEYMLRKQWFCCNPLWFETQLFHLRAHVPVTHRNLGTFQLQRLWNGEASTSVCTSCAQWFLCDAGG